MFGKVIPLKEELKMREFDTFRGVYCGLCKTLGKEHSTLARMALSYDFTFMALLLMAIDRDHLQPSVTRCMLHPLKKRMVYENHPALSYGAAMTVLLSWYKLKDDWQDERNVISYTGMGLTYHTVQKVIREYPQQSVIVKKNIDALNKLEKAACNISDEAAHTFASLLRDLFSEYPKANSEAKILGNIGYQMGRFVYLLDALEDIPKDIEKKRYNVIVNQYDLKVPSLLNQKLEEVVNHFEDSIYYTLDIMAKSYELLDIVHFKGILDNIFYMGLKRQVEKTVDQLKQKSGVEIPASINI